MKKLMLTILTMPLLLIAAAQAEPTEGMCDGLAGTGAAFGLCIAICSVPAEDPGCAPVFVDGVLREDSLDDCRPAAMKLVEKFQEKAPAGVELPCGDYQSSVACPCPDPGITNPACGSIGSTFFVNESGAFTNFTIANLSIGWICRTIFQDGSRVILPVPGQPGDGTEVDACLATYDSYCP